MLAGTDDHLTRLPPVIVNLESTGLTHLESEIRVHRVVLMHGKAAYCHVLSGVVRQIKVSRYRLRCSFVISFHVT